MMPHQRQYVARHWERGIDEESNKKQKRKSITSKLDHIIQMLVGRNLIGSKAAMIALAGAAVTIGNNISSSIYSVA